MKSNEISLFQEEWGTLDMLISERRLIFFSMIILLFPIVVLFNDNFLFFANSDENKVFHIIDLFIRSQIYLLFLIFKKEKVISFLYFKYKVLLLYKLHPHLIKFSWIFTKDLNFFDNYQNF